MYAHRKCFFILLTLLFPFLAFADSATELESIRVLGGGPEELALPLAPKKISKEKVEAFQYTDVNRALKQAPGVYVREEEGQGLRPNIGLRGTNPDRSKKIVLMEDGILIGPAPYAAPAAYYTPNMNHVESLEVYKGFSAISYGPNSIGGAINYISPSVPQKTTAKASLQAGNFQTRNFKIAAGTGGEAAGFLLQGSRIRTDGFKEIDYGGDAGFVREDAVGQFRLFLPPKSGEHHITFRVGYANEDSHETYLGLSADDFLTKSNRRYVASALDRMRWKHWTLLADHVLQLNESSVLRTTLYRHTFHRAWYRLDRFRGVNPNSIRSILKDPTGSNLPFYQILAGVADSSSLGGTNGQLVIANNDRDFVSQGVQSKWLSTLTVGKLSHEIELGARLHYDSIKRNHTYDYYSMDASRMNLVSYGWQDSVNEDAARAGTFSFQDNMSWNRFVFTMNGRYEYVAFAHADALTNARTKRKDSIFVPGVGVLFKANETLSLRSSVNRAVTVAGLDTSGKEKREEATNYEVGLKYYHPQREQAADLTFFWNNYQNLTGTCTASTGCSSSLLDVQYNGGKASILGLEAQLAQGFSVGRVWLPIQLNVTWMQAVFRNEFASSSAEWGVGTVRGGDPLPYVPRLQYTLSVGSEYRKWKQELAIVYQTKMADQSVSLGQEEIPAYGILDWTGSYEFSRALQFFAKADNLLNKRYLASLRPFGARPGKPRSFTLGLTYSL